MRILLVEDDESIVAVVTAILEQQNYVVDVATDGESGWELIEAFPYDLVLLDIVLPKLDGIALCRKLRSQKKQVLVMLLTAQDKTTDKLLGLDAGADDYVVKPFDVQELVARIRALLRRGNTAATPILTCGNLKLNPSAREVTYSGQLLRFSRKEYLLLELFLRHQHRVFSRSAIVDQIWSFSEEPPNEDTVKSHIKSIRRKLDAVGAGELIETLYGQGYRINPAYLAETRLAESAQQTLNLSVAEIWQRTKDTSLKRINFLEQVVQRLKSAGLDQELQQKAIQTAHKLSGSLGTFGFDQGSQIAQQLETLLQSTLGKLSPIAQKQMAAQIDTLVATLQDLLSDNRADASSPPAADNLADSLAASGSAPLLLICHLDPDFTQAITAQAAEHHLRVVASMPETAHQLCQQERPQAALLDLALLRAEQAAALLSDLQRQPAVPIVFLAAENSARERVAAVRAGGQLFFQKPVSPATVLPAIAEMVSAANRPRFKLLVVDDDPLIANALMIELEPQGVAVAGLTDPTRLWDILDVSQPLDLLILDVNMPDINGIELCRTIRCDLQWRWLPIVFLTAQLDRQTQQQIFLAGADDLITKPFEPTDLSTRLLNRLRRHQNPSNAKSAN